MAIKEDKNKINPNYTLDPSLQNPNLPRNGQTVIVKNKNGGVDIKTRSSSGGTVSSHSVNKLSENGAIYNIKHPDKVMSYEEMAQKYGLLPGDIQYIKSLYGFGSTPSSSVPRATENTPGAVVGPTSQSSVAGQLSAVPTSPTSSFSLTNGNLQQGAKGDNVKQLQTLLGITADGIYGPQTAAAVKDYQTKNGLTADGIVGPQTAGVFSKQTTGTPQNQTLTQGQSFTDPAGRTGTVGFDTVTGKPLVQGGTTSSNPGAVSGQLGALNSLGSSNTTSSNFSANGTNEPGVPGSSGADLSSYTNQVSALQNLSSEEIAANKAIQDQDNALRTGVHNVQDQPIGMSFISGQQASLENRATDLKIPLQQKLANAQAKRMASLDAAKTGLEQANKDREYKLAKDKLAFDSKPKPEDKTTDVQEYEYAKQQGYAGTFTQYQKDQANLKATIAKAGVQPLPTTVDTSNPQTVKDLATVNTINNSLDDPNFAEAFGIPGQIYSKIPGSNAQRVRASVQQVIDQLALAARGQLKGQGAVSDFEGQMLKNAQSALNFNLAPADAKQALINVRGAITTSSGGSAKVKITAPNGTSKVGSANSREITDAINQGFKVQYQ